MLALFCGFFRCFRLFGGFFEANWFLTLIAFDKKDNAVPMQSGVRVFGRAKTNYIIAKHVYTRRFLRDRSFLGVFRLTVVCETKWDETKWKWKSVVCEMGICSLRNGNL